MQVNTTRSFHVDTMTTQDSNVTQANREPSFYFPQEFKQHLEDLVFEILKEKPRDPLGYAFNFFSKRLKTREGIKSRSINYVSKRSVTLLA